jgi:peptide-methionine (S)-S-oxide reductase
MENTLGSLMLGLLTEARRSDLPYTEKKSKGAIDKVIVTLEGNESGKFTKNIVTEITPASEFFKAEDYHQQYYNINFKK